MPTQEQVVVAVISAIDAELSTYGAVSGAVKALDYDDAAKATLEHVQVALAPRFTDVSRGGRQAQNPWRLTTRPVANTVSNAREIEKRVDAAVRGVRFTVGGVTSTPVWFETSDEIGSDDGKFSGLTTWTFVL